MNGEEAYIKDVSSRLTGMDSKVKNDIVRELKTHIADLAAAHGGNVQSAMMNLEPPAAVARRYKELYGYSSLFKAIFIVIAAALGVVTLPVLQIRGEEVMVPVLVSLVFLSILIVFLIFVAVRAGRGAGLMAGLAACVMRLGVFGILAVAGGEDIVLQGGSVGLLIIVSLMLILVGYIPGEAKARWTKPSGEI